MTVQRILGVEVSAAMAAEEARRGHAHVPVLVAWHPPTVPGPATGPLVELSELADIAGELMRSSGLSGSFIRSGYSPPTQHCRNQMSHSRVQGTGRVTFGSGTALHRRLNQWRCDLLPVLRSDQHYA
jgi:hypothetical protein